MYVLRLSRTLGMHKISFFVIHANEKVSKSGGSSANTPRDAWNVCSGGYHNPCLYHA